MIMPSTSAPMPTRYEIRPARSMCICSRSSILFSLRTNAAYTINATIKPMISILMLLIGILKLPGFKNTAAIPRIAAALTICIFIYSLFYNAKNFFYRNSKIPCNLKREQHRRRIVPPLYSNNGLSGHPYSNPQLFLSHLFFTPQLLNTILNSLIHTDLL